VPQNSNRDYRDLVLWQKAMRLACAAYGATRNFPRDEAFGLTRQIRRAAVSVPSNVAEGSARRTSRDFLAFLHVARGSLAELRTELLIARDVGYLADDALLSLESLIDEVGRLLNAVIHGVGRRLSRVP
jgi:four helix bundle protein